MQRPASWLLFAVLLSCEKATSAPTEPPPAPPADERVPTPAEWDRAVTRPTEADAERQRLACAFARGSLPGETLGAGIAIERELPIETIVVVMQENRSFDHYFGHLNKYAGRTDVESAKDDVTNPVSHVAGSPTRPYQHAPHLCFLDTSHSWKASHEQYHDGKMDGFVVTNHAYEGEVVANPDEVKTDGGRAMWWHDERDIPFYYELAKTFSIADHYHASVLGPTWVNRSFFYGGTSFGLTYNTLPDVSGRPFPTDDVTVFDELEKRHVSWTLYAAGPPGLALTLGTSVATRWGRRVSKGMAEFHADAAAGTLPQVAFVDTNYIDVGDAAKGETEHPPENPQRGQRFVYEVVRSVTKSPQWKSLALFLTYDEHGGLYDHVPPPPACIPDASPVTAKGGGVVTGAFDRLGFRVPLLVVSPFAKRGFVSHATYDHTSVLRFIQAKHRLPALSARDANARIPIDMFDFGSPPFAQAPTFAEPPIDPAESEYCRVSFGK